jgi:hypothetical protein
MTYKQFLKRYRLRSTAETKKIYENRKARQVTTRKDRAAANLPGAEGLNRFRLSDIDEHTVSNFPAPDPRHTKNNITENSYLEITINKTKYRVPFWCYSVNFGYGSTGSSAQSRLYKSYYANNMNETPLTVTGRVPSEEYLADFGEWVRASQIQIAAGRELIRLYIPAAKINAIGFIPDFETSYKSGFEPGPEISFTFVLKKRDVSNADNSKFSDQVVSYFLYPNSHYWGKKSTSIYNAYSEIESELTKNIRTELNRREAEALAKARNTKDQAKRDKMFRDIANGFF